MKHPHAFKQDIHHREHRQERIAVKLRKYPCRVMEDGDTDRFESFSSGGGTYHRFFGQKVTDEAHLLFVIVYE